MTLWLFIFIVSLVLLVKGADWFLASAEKIGLRMGISPFVIGVAIVGVGTSFPELIAGFAAVFQGVTDIVPANAVGSNIANILLVVGISAIVGKRLTVTKDLIDLELPLLAVSTAFILGVLWDGTVTFWEAVMLTLLYVVYLVYTAQQRKDEKEPDELGFLPSRPMRRGHLTALRKNSKAVFEKLRVAWKDILMLFVGLGVLLAGAHYLVRSVVELSVITGIATGVISLVAISFGTSLPELLVSARAALQRKYEMSLGVVFGSNVFNALLVTGLPGLFAPLVVDTQTLFVGLPTLALATFLFVISGISRRVHVWEGIFYVALYILFIAKTFMLF